MLRRLPPSKNGDQTPTSATCGGFGLITSKPFKTPSSSAPKRDLVLPARKRKAVSYKGQGGGGKDDDDSDDEGKVVKKGKFEMGNKVYGEDGVLGDMAKWCNRKFPVFAPKEKSGVFTKRYVGKTSEGNVLTRLV
jgi:DNA repair and recombination RAD54-like protein